MHVIYLFLCVHQITMYLFWKEKKKKRKYINWGKATLLQDIGVYVEVACCHCLCKLWERADINK